LPIAIAQYEEKTRKHVDAIMILQPTCPLRTTEDINDAIMLYQTYYKDFNCLVSVETAPHIKKFYNADGYAMGSESAYDRHVDKDMYKRNSAVFIVKRSFFDKAHKLVDHHPLLYVMPKMRSVDVDTMDDMELAEAIMQYGR
jgi:CMP-N-acetylneuraminic acid synthetase